MVYAVQGSCVLMQFHILQPIRFIAQWIMKVKIAMFLFQVSYANDT